MTAKVEYESLQLMKVSVENQHDEKLSVIQDLTKKLDDAKKEIASLEKVSNDRQSQLVRVQSDLTDAQKAYIFL